MLGQIATFIENLHLPYDDVVYKIPYRNLCVMMRDKLHVVYDGDVRQEVSDDEFFVQMGKENPIKRRSE